MTIKIEGDVKGAAQAGRLLAEGRLVAFPTETVYGLGCDATDEVAVARLYDAKGRPSFNPLIIHVPDAASARALGRFDATAARLADAFWPGPLTLVVPAAVGSPVSLLARAGLDSLGLRVPGHALARTIVAASGKPIAAPSANRSGHVSPTLAAHVVEDLDGRIEAVIDGGPCPVGVESTIVACLGGVPRLLRPGGVSREAIETVIGAPLAGGEGAAIVAPGMTASHYAPRARLRLDATDPRPDEAHLAFGGAPKASGRVLDLSPRGDVVEAAANLFRYLRLLDGEGHAGIAVAPIPRDGLGEAIHDRLARAAAEKG